MRTLYVAEVPGYLFGYICGFFVGTLKIKLPELTTVTLSKRIAADTPLHELLATMADKKTLLLDLAKKVPVDEALVNRLRPVFSKHTLNDPFLGEFFLQFKQILEERSGLEIEWYTEAKQFNDDTIIPAFEQKVN